MAPSQLLSPLAVPLYTQIVTARSVLERMAWLLWNSIIVVSCTPVGG